MLKTVFNELVSPSYYRIGINYALSMNDEEMTRHAMQDYFDNLDYIAPEEQHEELKAYWRNEFRRQFGKVFVHDLDAIHYAKAPF